MKCIGKFAKFMVMLRLKQGRLRACARYFGACFLFASLTAHGACTNWSHGLGAADQSPIYAGNIGGHPVRMMLHYDGSANRFSGAYGYAGQSGVLKVSGRLTESGAGALFTEYDEKGVKTGQFSLGFDSPKDAFESEAHYRHRVAQPSCGDLIGTWSSKSGKILKVNLYRSGTIDPRFDGERKKNEAVASKLRVAMISRNKKEFASLLAYPFYSENAMQDETKWKNPDEVEENYDKIVKFSENEIHAAVPHFLETSAKTLFMNGSIFIRNGKVTRVCEQVCSNSTP